MSAEVGHAKEENKAWINAFDANVKTTKFESFSLLLYDFQSSSTQQKQLLHKVLFESGGATSAQHWGNYVEFCMKQFPDRRSQLQRLVNKALELIDEVESRNNKYCVRLHLYSAQLKSDAASSLKYFENIIWKREIGRKLAVVYCTWAELIVQSGGGVDAGSAIIRKGLANMAEPRHTLQSHLQQLSAKASTLSSSLSASSAPLKEADQGQECVVDSEVAFRVKRTISTEKAVPSSELSDSDDEATARLNVTSSLSESVTHTHNEILVPVNQPLSQPPSRRTRSSATKEPVPSPSSQPDGGPSAGTGGKRSRMNAFSTGLIAAGAGRCQRVVVKKGRGEVDVSASEEVDELILDEKPEAEARTAARSAPKPAPAQALSAFDISAVDINSMGAKVASRNKDADLRKNSCEGVVKPNSLAMETQSQSHGTVFDRLMETKKADLQSRRIDDMDADVDHTATVSITSTVKVNPVPVPTVPGDGGAGSAAVSSSPSSPSSSRRPKAAKAKVNLSKYVDDKLLNFNPQQRQMRVAAQTEIIVDRDRSGDIPSEKIPKAGNLSEVGHPTRQTTSKGTIRIADGAIEGAAAVTSKSPIRRGGRGLQHQNSNKSDSDGDGDAESDADTSPLELSTCATEKLPLEKMIQASKMDTHAFAMADGQGRAGLVTEISSSASSSKQDVAPFSASKRGRISTAEAPSSSQSQTPRDRGDDGMGAGGAALPGSTGVSSSRKRVSFARSGVPLSMITDSDVAGGAYTGTGTPAGSFNASGLISLLTDPTRHLNLNGRGYLRVGILGKGGSSCVHRVLSDEGQLCAYKRVDVRSNDDSDAVFDSYINEIELLRRLKGSPYIIELLDAEVNRHEQYIAMVMEAGEVDLSKVLSQMQRKAATTAHSALGARVEANSSSNGALTMNPFFARLVWQEMLEAVDHIHSHRIVHGDLKPANFVFVRGHLKLIDFGIAKAFNNDTTNIYRESQIGTVNYMAPEAIAPFAMPSDEDAHGTERGRMRLGRASDIWSLGCILYQIEFGRPPFAALNTIQKLHAIPNPKVEIAYPANADVHCVDSIQVCLQRDPNLRAPIRGEGGLLSRSYLAIPSRVSEPSASVPIAISGTSVLNQEQASRTDCALGNLGTSSSSPSSVIPTDKATMAPRTSVRGSGKITTPAGPLDKQTSTSVATSASKARSNSASREPLKPIKALPANLLNQIHMQQAGLKNLESSAAARWMKPRDSPEKQDMRSVLERRLIAMRTFLDAEQDNTIGEQENTDGNSFF